MKELKIKLHELITSLPEDKEELVSYEELRKMGFIFSEVSIKMVETYTISYLNSWIQHGRLDDFLLFLKSLFVKNSVHEGTFDGGFRVLNNWILEINDLIKNQLLPEKIKNVSSSYSEQLKATLKQFEPLEKDLESMEQQFLLAKTEKDKLSNLLEEKEAKSSALNLEIEKLGETKESLEITTLELQNKQSEKEQLQISLHSLEKASLELPKIEKEVKELKAEVKKLQHKIDTAEKEKATKTQEKSASELRLGLLFKHLEILSNSDAMLEEVTEKLEKRNEEIIKELKTDYEELEVHLHTDESIINHMGDESLKTAIEKLKQNLKQIDKQLKEKLKEDFG